MKVLLADDDTERARYLVDLLARDAANMVVRVAPGELLPDAVATHAPDVILVDMSRPDRDALEAVRMVARSQPHPVVLFVDEDDPAFMEEAIGAGVCSYNVGSLARAEVKPVLRAAVALFRQMRITRAALDVAETKLRDRALLDAAKQALIRERRMSEPEAHRWLQRQAMSTGQRLADVARALVDGADRKPAP